MDKEQKEQLKRWGINPKSIKSKPNLNIGYILLGVFIGIIIALAFVQLELSPQWVTNQHCNNISIQAFQYGYTQGIINVANYTTFTGNFTHIFEDTVQVKSIKETCYIMFPQLNEMEVKKTWQQ